MVIPFNSKCFGQTVWITASREKGQITGFSCHMRSKKRQFYVEYVGADGRFTADWFFEDQLQFFL